MLKGKKAVVQSVSRAEEVHLYCLLMWVRTLRLLGRSIGVRKNPSSAICCRYERAVWEVAKKRSLLILNQELFKILL